MGTYKVYVERTVVEEAWIKADSAQEAEKLADINFTDYNWSYVDGTMSTEILIGATEEI